MATTKIDLTRERRDLYAPGREPALVEVPPFRFLTLAGQGDPNTSPAYVEAIEALYGLSYTIKFTLKRERALDYRVLPLEGLWWADSMEAFVRGDKSTWQWLMMIRQPDEVDEDALARALAALRERKKEVPAAARVRLETLDEGRAAQVMHVGPYSSEGPTIERLHAFIAAQGLVPAGRHHEIYLGDPRRSAPEKLKTIVRQPVANA